MAIAADTALTYDGKTIREDLSDVIYNIAPMDTPFMSGCAKTKADNVLFQWQTDTITAGAANRHLEGDDSPAALDAPQPTKLQNYCQISRYVLQTSGTDQVVNYAGRGKAQAYQLAKAGKRMKRDMELMLTSNTAPVSGGTTTARATAGLPTWFPDASFHGGGSTTGSAATGNGTDVMTNGAATAAATEAKLKTIIKKVYDVGGQPDMMIVPATVKQTISGLASVGSGSVSLGIPQRNPVSGTGGATAVASVDVYVSDFGTFKIVPDRNLAADGPGSVAANVFVMDMDYWAISWLRPFHTVNLAKQGDSVKQMLLAEYGLVSRNSASSGILAGVS